MPSVARNQFGRSDAGSSAAVVEPGLEAPFPKVSQPVMRGGGLPPAVRCAPAGCGPPIIAPQIIAAKKAPAAAVLRTASDPTSSGG
jgi:hypothetical protein